MSGESKIEKILSVYFSIIDAFTDAVFEPPRRFFEPFSKSISESFRIVSKVATNFIALLPLFAVSLGIGIYLFGAPSSEITEIEPFLVLSVMMFFASVISFVIMSSSDYDLSESIYMSALLILGALSIMLFETPEVYAVLFGVIYGIGGYIRSYIGHENPLPHGHIYDNLEPQKTIKRVSLIGLIAGLAAYGAGEYLMMNGANQQTLIIVAGLIPATGFLVSSLQFESYRKIYQHAELKKSSRLWILTPRLLVILGVAVSISSMEVGIVSLLALLSPSVFGLVFSYYLSWQTEKILGQKTFKDSNMLSNPVRITGNEEAEVGADVDKGSDTAQLNVEIGVNISDDIPDKSADPWFEAVAVSRELLEAINNLKRVDDEVSEEVREFKQDALEVAIEKHQGSSIDWDEIPESIRPDVIAIKCRKGELDLQEVNDLDVRFSETRSKKSAKRYADRI